MQWFPLWPGGRDLDLNFSTRFTHHLGEKLLGMASDLDSGLCANVFLYLTPGPAIQLQRLQELLMLFLRPLLPLLRDRVWLPRLDRMLTHSLLIGLHCDIHR